MTSIITNKHLEIFNPANSKKISSISMTCLDELDEKFDIARKTADSFNYSSLFYRQNLINRFRKGIVDHIDDFIDVICSETGKKPAESLMEIFISLEHLKESTKNIYKSLGPRSRRVGMLKVRKAWIEYEAMGIAGIISPWNYPLILAVSPLIEALLAGNVVVLKPSEHTPLTTQLLKKVWDQTTDMPNLFHPVYGGEEIGSAIVKSSYTDVICFTGSVAVGKKIAEICAPIFKPVILELGGKDPMIILEDANIDRSVEAALWGGLSNAGQTCISVERILVHKKIYSILVDKLSKSIKKISAGPHDELIGPISIEKNMQNINQQVEDAKKSSKVVEGIRHNGCFIAPTLVINPPLTAKILRDETFGPVMTINSFSTIDNAIEFANNTGYGLSASIFGRNMKNIKYISRRLNVGAVCINDVLTHYGISDLPFGGKGLSGIGKVHGIEGLRAFSSQKAYLNNWIQLKSELWWFKRNKIFWKYLKKWIKWIY